MFFEKTKAFDLEKHFDPNHPNVRIRIRELFERTRETIARERRINLEVVLLIGCLEVENAAVNLGIGKREDLAKCLGLTPNQYWKRAQAGRVLFWHPEFIDLITSGKTHISHIAIIAPKITEANKDIFLSELSGKSERDVRELAASVKKNGERKEVEPTLDIRLSFTASELRILDRAREVLSATGRVPCEEEVVIKALGDLLEKRDPIKKAERAVARKSKKEKVTSVPKSEKKETPYDQKAPTGIEESPDLFSLKKTSRKPISASTKHKVFLRDQGQCTYKDPNGKRCCSKITLQIDHKISSSSWRRKSAREFETAV